MSESTLISAAQNAFTNLDVLWVAGTLKTQLVAFYTGLFPLFPDQAPNNHPVANWGVLLAAATSQLPSSNVSFLSLAVIADQLYRLCYLASVLATQNLISNTQATALLALYNAEFT